MALAQTVALVQGYGTAAPLSPAQARLIPDVYRWFRLNDLRPDYNHYILGDGRTGLFPPLNLRACQQIETLGADMALALARASEPAWRRWQPA